jgi:hypothetical protein
MTLNQRMDNSTPLTQWNTIQLKNKDSIKLADKWMKLENILSEITQTQKHMHDLYSLVSGYNHKVWDTEATLHRHKEAK